MSFPPPKKTDDDEVTPPQRPPSPPSHTTFRARNFPPPNFSAFKPRDIRITNPGAMNHVAWSCDGKRLAAVGIDKAVRIWTPDKSMEYRSATVYTGGHTDEIDYISWNPLHPDLFCTSSAKDRRIVFWDARQSRHTQLITLRSGPVITAYNPDGKSMVYTTTNKAMYFLHLTKNEETGKDQWEPYNRNPISTTNMAFNHTGDGIVFNHYNEPSIRLIDYSLDMPSDVSNKCYGVAAHVDGCVTVAFDPRGKYLATGGNDSIVNLFDTSEWVCARTITSCEAGITGISFSHDGEFIAISNQGNYIDICATETGMPLHRIPALGSSPTVQWHPSRYIIAYCGQTKVREGGPPPSAWISLFGPGM